RLPAEEAIDPVKDDARQVLDLESRRALNSQDQGGRFRRSFGGPRPVDLERLAVGRDLRPDDVRPARYDLGRGETLRPARIPASGSEQLGKRPWKTARGLAHANRPCAMVRI